MKQAKPTKQQKKLIKALNKYCLKDPTKHKEPFVINAIGGSGKTFSIGLFLLKFNKILELRSKVLKKEKDPIHILSTATLNSVVARNYDHYMTLLGSLPGKYILLHGNISAKSLHSLMNYKPLVDKETNRLTMIPPESLDIAEGSILIIDESSRIDKKMYKLIKKYYVGKAHVIIVGDSEQILGVDVDKPYAYTMTKNHHSLKKIIRNADPVYNRYVERMRGNVKKKRIDAIPYSMGNVLTRCSNKKKFLRQITKKFTLESKLSKIITHTNKRVDMYNKYIHYDLLGNKDLICINAYLLYTGVFSIEDIFTYIQTGNSESRNGVLPKVSRSYAESGSMVTISSVHINQSRVQLCRLPRGLGNLYIKTAGVNYKSDLNKDKLLNVKLILSYKFSLIPGAGQDKVSKDYLRALRTMLNNRVAFKLNYASTVHKIQGSSIKNVFLDIENSRGLFNQPVKDIARFIYIAVSRPTSKIFVLGDIPKFLIKGTGGWKR